MTRLDRGEGRGVRVTTSHREERRSGPSIGQLDKSRDPRGAGYYGNETLRQGKTKKKRISVDVVFTGKRGTLRLLKQGKRSSAKKSGLLHNGVDTVGVEKKATVPTHFPIAFVQTMRQVYGIHHIG